MVVLSPDVLPEIRMTVDEYLHADLPEGYRYELVEGVVEMAPPPDWAHDSVVRRLDRRFVLYSEQHPDILAEISLNAAVTLADRHSAREPDLAVYGPEVSEDNADMTWKVATPILVIEVISPGQEDRDYRGKRRDYWEAGVGAYWIFHKSKGLLTVLNRGATEWVEEQFDRSQTYRPAQFPGLELPVGEILGT